jgi:hypothetical protein
VTWKSDSIFLIVPNELPQVPMSNDTTWHVQIYINDVPHNNLNGIQVNGCGLICWFWNVAAETKWWQRNVGGNVWCNKKSKSYFSCLHFAYVIVTRHTVKVTPKFNSISDHRFPLDRFQPTTISIHFRLPTSDVYYMYHFSPQPNSLIERSCFFSFCPCECPSCVLLSFHGL